MLLMLALACGGGEQAGRTYTGPLVEQAACEPTDNPLRIACTMRLGAPGEVEWSMLRGGEPIRTARTPHGIDHEVVLWGLPPDTELQWQGLSAIGTAAGTIRTGSLPSGIGDVTLSPSGTARTLRHMALRYKCNERAGVMLAGTDGQVWWYEDAPGDLTAFHFTSDGRVVMILDDERVLVQQATGALAFETAPLPLPLHHDVAVAGDHVYALYAERIGDNVVDGLYVIDAEGQVHTTWSLADHVEITDGGEPGGFWQDEFPDAVDWSHANGVTADGPDHLLLSLRALHAVVRIASDPDGADFGEIDWVLAGVTGGPLLSDFTWMDGGSFFGQHHALRHSSGGISVFDNGSSRVQSRALVLDLDEGIGGVSESASWSMGTRCPNQGGAYELPGGGMVATCDATMTVHEFVADEPDPVFIQEIGCATGDAWLVQRAIPVTLD